MSAKNHKFAGLVLREHGEQMRVEALSLREPRGVEVLVKMRAAGVCHSDLHARDGGWSTPMPTVLGHEGAGVVVAVGDAVTSVNVGDHVMLSWVAPCRNCVPCAAGRGWACIAGNDFSGTTAAASELSIQDGHTGGVNNYLGVGSFAEYSLLSETAVVAIPDAVPFDVAALMSCSVATGVGAVFNDAQVTAGSRVVVFGAGGIGLSIVMACRLAGASQVIVIDVTARKLETAREIGATTTINAIETDPVQAVNEILSLGADIVFDAVGRISTMEQALQVLSRGGSCVLVGMPAEGERLSIDPLSLSSMGQTIVGSNFGSTVPLRDFPKLCAMYLAGQLPVEKLMSEHITLDGVEAAFERMKQGEGTRAVVSYAA